MKKYVSASLIFGAAFAASAQETLLPQLDIEGKVTPEEQRLKKTAPEVSIKAETFEKQAGGPIIKDVIKRMPGVYTVGAPGENKDVRLRGLDKEYSRVQFDGVQLPDGGEKRELNIDRLPSAMVGDVKIIRSPQAEYEADGIAGRVHIEARDIPTQDELTVTVAGGQQDNENGHQGSISGSKQISEQFAIQGVLSTIKDPLSKAKQKIAKDGSLKETETELKPVEHTSMMLDAAIYYDSGRFNIKPLYLKDDESKDKLKAKYKDGVIKEFEAETESKVKETFGLGIENKHYFTEQTKLDSNIGFYRTTEEKDKLKRKLNASSLEDTKKQETEDESKQDQFWQADIKLSHQWNSGFDNELKVGTLLRSREREREKNKYKAGKPQKGDAKDNYKLSEDYYALFLQNEMHLTDAFSLLPGVRVERVDLTSQDGLGNSDSNSQTDFLPSLSANYRITETLAWHGAVAQTLNRPKFDDLSPYAQDKGDGTIVVGNPDLKAAKANTFDTGFNYVTEPLFLGVNVFYRQIDGVIEQIDTGELIDGNRVLRVEDAGDGYVRGVELEQRFSWQSLTLTTNQTFIDSELKMHDGSKTPFKEQPKFIGNVIVDWSLTEDTLVSLAYRYTGKTEQSEQFKGLAAENYLDLKINHQLAPKWSVFASATNLTNEQRVKTLPNGEVEKEQTDTTFWLGVQGAF
jgi:outer membrane receptor for ferrienterochelin and colicin